jgi:xylan 1,4-beta-xylosidase
VASDAVTTPIRLPDSGPVRLRAEIDEERLRFAYAIGDDEWAWLPNVFDASILSDEAMVPGTANFTGNFVGVCCQDLSGTGRQADFDYFIYKERDYRPNPCDAHGP